ncbi:helix-turn-helix transcriptional regulator, partial [Streptomyces sp. KAI-27]|nr:helix-turn-helix transcriptional regulator [Streptomyces sp. KAI-27]
MEAANDPVAALLEDARLRKTMPPPAERQRLREAAGLTRGQVADACQVRRQTIANWEEGKTTPKPPGATAYARLLDGLKELHPAAAGDESATQPDNTLTPQPEPVAATARPHAAAPSPTPTPNPTRPQRRARSSAQAQDASTGLITAAVHEELEKAGGDVDAAQAALIKRAIDDVMTLWRDLRTTGRYEYTSYPALPDIFKKPSKKEPDQIWEARPGFRHPGYSLRAHGDILVTALDANAAYLSAMKCWLPIGKLEHSTGTDGVDPKRSGVHLITPAPWNHPHLPNPLGDRDTEGTLWVTDATLRLLLRLSGPKYGLTERPTVHESWTSHATENFLDALRKALTAARATAIAADDTLTTEYVKAMYSKFIST